MQGIIILNKPAGFTSMDCCAIIRKLAGEKKVGHTGTLDPNATGVLPICIGKATRLIEYMDFGSKTYIAGFCLGLSSDTEDIWGEIKEETKVSVSEQNVKEALSTFLGDIEQIPPMYSAKKIDGQRLYDIARSGKEIERNAQTIHIYNSELLSFDGENGVIKIECSRGTYIRTICAELGRKLGTSAVMTSLVRTSASGYDISEAVDLQTLRDNPKLITECLKPIEIATRTLKRIDLDEKQYKLFANGNPILKFNDEGLLAVFYMNRLAGIVKDKKIKKVFHENI